MKITGEIELTNDIKGKINDAVQKEIASNVKRFNIRERMLTEAGTRIRKQVDKMRSEGAFNEMFKKISTDAILEKINTSSLEASILCDINMDKLRDKICDRVIEKVSDSLVTMIIDDDFKKNIKSKILNSLTK